MYIPACVPTYSRLIPFYYVRNGRGCGCHLRNYSSLSPAAATTAVSPHKRKRKRREIYERYDGPIVISGISGRFPKCDTYEVLKENLLSGMDLTSDGTDRWVNEDHPKRFGLLKCLDKFDANFFNMTPRQADQHDPQMRLLLEVVFEALIDAGGSFFLKSKVMEFYRSCW